MDLNLKAKCHAPNNKCAYPQSLHQCIEPDYDDGIPRVCPYLSLTHTPNQTPPCFGKFNTVESIYPCEPCELSIICAQYTDYNQQFLKPPCDTCRVKSTNLCQPETCPTKLLIRKKPK